MKLQNLAIIFIVILIPIILIVSYYLNLQKSTLSLQTSYDQKLVESAKEAIQAFEINTTEWNSIYSNLSDSKRRDVMASINTFISSLSNNLGIGGTATENLLSYIPAIAFTLYDGYYVYAPAYTPVVATDDDGIAQYENGNLLYDNGTEEGTTNLNDLEEDNYKYEHTLTTYLPYSKKYDDIVVDYTLDNYIKVYGKDSSGNVIERSGNLVYFQSGTSGFNIDNDFENITYNGKVIGPEILEEKIAYNEGGTLKTKTYIYIYDLQNEKYYFENEDGENKGKFFRVVDGQKVYLSEDVSIGDFGAKFRKIVVRKRDTNIDVYQLLNGKTEGTYNEWYVDINDDGNLDERITENGEADINGVDEEDIWEIVENISRTKDYSAMNYYIDAYDFTNWAANDLEIDCLKISETNNPENSDSAFAEEKRAVIKKCVQETLNTSITQYAKQTDGYQFRLTQLSETDWDQLLRNASITAFFQGVPIGLKYYNNYAIATSTTNKEFINKDEIYFSIER